MFVICSLLVFSMGCSSSLQENKVKLKFSTWGSAEELALIRELIRDFEKKYPHIQVELVHIPENYFQKLHILIAGELTPDVMFVNSLSYPIYAEHKIFMPLDKYLYSNKSVISRKTFFEPALKAFQWRGELYAIPRDISNLVVFYNKNMFQKAGLPSPSPEWQITDMLNMAKKLTKDTDGDKKPDQFGISFFAKPPLFWLPFVWSEGGDMFDNELSRFVLVKPEATQAIQFYSDLRNRWHVAPRREEVGSASMSQLFLQENLAMLISGRWSVPVLRSQAKFGWDVAPFPKGKKGSIAGIDASGYAISQSTKYPKESWTLVEFLSSPESQKIFSKSGLIIPARKDVAGSRDFINGQPEHGKYFIDAISIGSPTHVPLRWNEIAEELDVALESVWEGRVQADKAIKAVSPKIEKLLQ